MQRVPESEVMDLEEEVAAYVGADFTEVNDAFVERLLTLTARLGRDLDTAGGQKPLVLDLGCGPGDIALRLAEARPGCVYLAVDASLTMLRRATRDPRRAQTTIGLVQADAKLTPLPSRTVDVLISNSLLHHLPDPAPLWSEVRRLLRPGGLLLLRDLTRPESSDAAKRLVLKHSGEESALLQEEFYRSLLAAYTEAEIQQQIEAAELGEMHVELVSDRHLDVWGIASDS